MKPHICHVSPSFGTGGPEVRTALLIDASVDEFRHTVISLNGELSGRDRVASRDAVRFLAAPRAGDIRGLGRTLGDLRPDLLLTYGWGGTDALLAARLCGLRRVLHAEDGFLPDESVRQRLPRLLARRVLLRLSRQVVCPSQTLVRIAKKSWWLPDHRIRYIPNGVDLRRFAPPTSAQAATARRRLGCTESEIVIGTVGRLGAEKNHERLIRAFAAVSTGRPTKLLIVGDGPLRNDLGRLVRELGIESRTLFAGRVVDPFDLYHAMDVFALSSDTEQMPIVLLEAMAVGLPIVSTDVGDVGSMLSPANLPFVVPAGRDDLYGAALATLIDDAEVRAQLGRENRTTCQERYSIDAMIDAYLELYRGALEGNRHRATLRLPAEA